MYIKYEKLLDDELNNNIVKQLLQNKNVFYITPPDLLSDKISQSQKDIILQEIQKLRLGFNHIILPFNLIDPNNDTGSYKMQIEDYLPNGKYQYEYILSDPEDRTKIVQVSEEISQVTIQNSTIYDLHSIVLYGLEDLITFDTDPDVNNYFQEVLTAGYSIPVYKNLNSISGELSFNKLINNNTYNVDISLIKNSMGTTIIISCIKNKSVNDTTPTPSTPPPNNESLVLLSITFTDPEDNDINLYISPKDISTNIYDGEWSEYLLDNECYLNLS